LSKYKTFIGKGYDCGGLFHLSLHDDVCNKIVNNVIDEILMYRYVKPRSNGSRTKKTPDRPLQDRPGVRGLCPSGMLVRIL
jgi:hypothetical protein